MYLVFLCNQRNSTVFFFYFCLAVVQVRAHIRVSFGLSFRVSFGDFFFSTGTATVGADRVSFRASLWFLGLKVSKKRKKNHRSLFIALFSLLNNGDRPGWNVNISLHSICITLGWRWLGARPHSQYLSKKEKKTYSRPLKVKIHQNNSVVTWRHCQGRPDFPIAHWPKQTSFLQTNQWTCGKDVRSRAVPPLVNPVETRYNLLESSASRLNPVKRVSKQVRQWKNFRIYFK